jgi:hypothetical protein
MMLRLRQWTSGVARWLTEPASPLPLAVLRVSVSVVLLGQALAVSGRVDELFGTSGALSSRVNESMLPAGVPRLSWALAALSPLGVSEAWCMRAVFLVYVAALAGLLLGRYTRPVAVVAWAAHLALTTSGWLTTYGVDAFANIALFYCAVFPTGGNGSMAPSVGARAGLRLLQLHLCVVYLFSGVEKGTGVQWWNGEAIWRAVMRPDFAVWDLSWLADYSWVAVVSCWMTLLIEVGYALFVWVRWTRLAWPLLTGLMHLGIAVILGLASFSALMIALNVAAFLVPSEPSEPTICP